MTSPTEPMSRRRMLSGGLAAGLALACGRPARAAESTAAARAATATEPLKPEMNAKHAAGSPGARMQEDVITRPVPSSGESLPAIGLGTWQTFDVGEREAAREPLRRVLRDFAGAGGSVLDSSPMYGRSEDVAGDLQAELGLRPRLFVATKVWTRGREAGVRQMEESMRKLRVETVDLMQVHNLLDAETHIETLGRWKDEGRVRYIGITHYNESAHAELERAIARYRVDFVQLNYSLLEPEADRRLLPLARDRGVAVLVNRPFGAGGLFSRVRGKPLPPMAGELGVRTWAQFFLKWIVGHPAVTCAIPATSDPVHLADNMGALRGRLPDAGQRDEMARAFRRL